MKKLKVEFYSEGIGPWQGSIEYTRGDEDTLFVVCNDEAAWTEDAEGNAHDVPRVFIDYHHGLLS